MEGDANHFVQTAKQDSFDIVVNDLFTEQDSPPFIHTNAFLRSVFRSLKPHGLYFANTISDTFEFTHQVALEKIGYDVLRFPKKQTGITNIIYEVVKD